MIRRGQFKSIQCGEGEQEFKMRLEMGCITRPRAACDQASNLMIHKASRMKTEQDSGLERQSWRGAFAIDFKMPDAHPFVTALMLHHMAIACALILAYHGCYLVLQFDHPVPLSDLYRQRAEIPDLVARAQWQDALNRPVELYEIQE